MIKIFCFSLFCLSISCLTAQNFTKDRDKFIKETQRLFIAESELEFVKEKLPKLVNSTLLSDTQFNKMIDGANAIYKKHSDYLLSCLYVRACLFQVENKFNGSFNSEWNQINSIYLEKELEDFQKFIEFSANFFQYRSITSTDSFRWTFTSGSFEWNQEKGVKIICNAGTLSCYLFSQSGKNQDSIIIKNTSGVLDLDLHKFIGANGTVTWEKAGFSKLETFAELRRYKVDLNKSTLKVDTVSLTTPYFPTPILGKLIDKFSSDLTDDEGAPQFNSFEKRLKIKALRENVDYDGGFSLQGAKFIGKGEPENPAKLIFNYKQNKLFEISSLNFLMDPTQIISRDARLKMQYKNGDSLVVDECLFYFDESKKLLTATSKKIGGVAFPFTDYFLKLNVYAPVLQWKLNSPQPYYTYEVGTTQEQKVINIESINYFDEQLFDKLKGMSKNNPLTSIANYVDKNGSLFISEGELANVMSATIETNKSLMYDLVSKGFLQYDGNEKMITVTDKLVRFAAAKNGKSDYDNIAFKSDLRPRNLDPQITKEQIDNNPNLKQRSNEYEAMNSRYKFQPYFAFIDIDKQQMFVTGTDFISISNVQKTAIEPDSAQFIVKGNRDMHFKGWLTSGKFNAQVLDADFRYDDFKFQLNALDYAALNVRPLRKEDGENSIEMLSSFSYLKGELLIDHPSSRSGKSNLNSTFPKLLIPGSARILYNAPEIVRGAYDSSRFFYRLDPFELDSLDDFSELALNFKGELISGGIFPPLKESLKIMNDYSFGFFTVAPAGGLPFYGDASRYENKILLSNNGLQGAGTINFLSASAISKKLTFLPDSTIGVAQFTNVGSEKGIAVPQVFSEAAFISFLPKKQVLKASAYKNVNLEMFENQCQLNGTVMLSKSGMNGMGQILFNDAVMNSRKYNFTYYDILSDTASFALRNKYVTEGDAPLAIETDGVKSFVSFKDRKGEFNSFGSKRIKFPANVYYCTMDKFFWYMDGESVDFEKNQAKTTTFEAGADLNEPNFFSMDDRQDSLRYRSLSAKYDLKTQTIFCNKVEYVQVGDAKIYPDSMKITIRKQAYMDPLKNAVIVANYITKYHRFTEADVQISSRKKYEGICRYPYYDRDSLLTTLSMQSIKYEGLSTVAEGDVEQKMQFKLSPEFDYYGKVKVLASNPGIFCDGSTRINHQCRSFDRSWLAFKDTVNAKNIQIPISEQPLNDKGNRLAVGFLWKDDEKMDSVLVYPAFLSKIEGKNDAVIFQSSGYVQYNPKAEAFQIATKEMLDGTVKNQNILTFYTSSCSLTGIGKISLGIDLGEVKVESFGDINYDPIAKKIGMNLTSKFIFPLQKNIMEGLAASLKEVENQKDADVNSKSYNFKEVTKYWLNQEEENDFYKDYEEDKLRKMPVNLQGTMLISGLHYEFFRIKTKSNETGLATGFVTKKSTFNEEGEEQIAKNKIVLISLEDKPVLKELDMNIILHQTNSDASNQGLMMKWTNANNKDYFINYKMDKKDGEMLLYAKDEAFNTSISEIKPEKKKSKNFKFDLADETSLKLIIVKFNDYLRSK
jgi:hypothetical protein